MPRSSYIAAAAAVALLTGAAAADPGTAPGHAAPDDEIVAPPPTYKANGVNVEEHLGARVPLDARFRTLDGTVTTLGEVLRGELRGEELRGELRGELPAILTFNYAECPMLCNLQLNGLVAALPAVAAPGRAPAGAPASAGSARGDVAFRAGEQFRIITISLEPAEPLERLGRMRDRYIARLPEGQREAARRGWTFLAAETPGEAAAIRRVADAVGFKYVYVTERGEWAHPAALIFLSASGTVTRYVHGIEFAPEMMRESIFKAGLSEPATAVGFLNRCYHYDPAASDHSKAAVSALRIGAAGFAVLLIAGLGMLHLVRRAKARSPSDPRSMTPGG
jgi:protein SCO1/2